MATSTPCSSWTAKIRWPLSNAGDSPPAVTWNCGSIRSSPMPHSLPSWVAGQHETAPWIMIHRPRLSGNRNSGSVERWFSRSRGPPVPVRQASPAIAAPRASSPRTTRPIHSQPSAFASSPSSSGSFAPMIAWVRASPAFTARRSSPPSPSPLPPGRCTPAARSSSPARARSPSARHLFHAGSRGRARDLRRAGAGRVDRVEPVHVEAHVGRASPATARASSMTERHPRSNSSSM